MSESMIWQFFPHCWMNLYLSDLISWWTDLLHVASLHLNKVASSRVSLKCFAESFAAISTISSLFSELPPCCQPADGPGVLVDLTDKLRWQLFACWIVKLVSKCLTEGTLYVEGLVRMSFISAACSLLCFGDAALHMVGDWFAPNLETSTNSWCGFIFPFDFIKLLLSEQACYDFARIITTVLDDEIVPVKNIIRSMACILAEDDKEFAVFRYIPFVQLPHFSWPRARQFVRHHGCTFYHSTLHKFGPFSAEFNSIRLNLELFFLIYYFGVSSICGVGGSSILQLGQLYRRLELLS